MKNNQDPIKPNTGLYLALLGYPGYLIDESEDSDKQEEKEENEQTLCRTRSEHH